MNIESKDAPTLLDDEMVLLVHHPAFRLDRSIRMA